MEEKLQNFLSKNTNMLTSGLKCVAKEFSLNPKWLQEDKSSPCVDPWDHYSCGPNRLDLLLWNEPDHCLVLAEVKWGGGNGEGGLMQLLDYYQLLKDDSETHERICEKEEKINIKLSLQNAELYLIIGGHISEILKKRVSYLRQDLQQRIKIFQAIPLNIEDPQNLSRWNNTWNITLVFPIKWFTDIHNRSIRLTKERQEHLENAHPEMSAQIDNIHTMLLEPDIIVQSRTDPCVELFYKHYDTTPVTEKYLCIVVKVLNDDLFIITAYFTDTIKKGELLWKKK